METPLEYLLTHSAKAEMVVWMHNHPEVFEETVGLAISDKQPYSRRAAWLLWSCTEKKDLLAKKFVNQIIDALPARTDEQQRDLLITLRQAELIEEQEATLFDFCISIWEKVGKKPSVRFNAFKMMVAITQKRPELKNEIRLLVQYPYLESLSPTARKSILKMVDQIE
ncbi:MAG TPA: hypothetical protein PLB87_03250 [Prolixibacteraceae bacterium]|nr:hypothetical protein [Prolixibacteraceae bacterium]